MPRTNVEAVGEVIRTNPRLVVTPFIAVANSLTNKVASADVNQMLTASDLVLIETWLAAHFYAHRDQQLQSESRGGVSGQYKGQTAMFLESTQYGQTAITLDVTGFLALRNQESQSRVATAGAFWLGICGNGSGEAGEGWG